MDTVRFFLRLQCPPAGSACSFRLQVLPESSRLDEAVFDQTVVSASVPRSLRRHSTLLLFFCSQRSLLTSIDGEYRLSVDRSALAGSPRPCRSISSSRLSSALSFDQFSQALLGPAVRSVLAGSPRPYRSISSRRLSSALSDGTCRLSACRRRSLLPIDRRISGTPRPFVGDHRLSSVCQAIPLLSPSEKVFSSVPLGDKVLLKLSRS